MNNRIKVSHEVPPVLLDLSKHFNDYDYMLPHLMDENEAYRDYFINAKKKERYIVMDNSLHELGHAYKTDRQGQKSNDPTDFSRARPRSAGARLYGSVKAKRIQLRYRHQLCRSADDGDRQQYLSVAARCRRVPSFNCRCGVDCASGGRGALQCIDL